MGIKHIRLDEMYRAYAAAILQINNKNAIMVASEEKGYPCYMYTGEHFDHKETVWEEGGGCMSIIQIPNVDNQFLAIRDFYLKESPSNSKLVWGQYLDGEWVIKDVLKLPYLHRFDIYSIAGKTYFVGATIADEKDFKDDWSRSGSIYVGEITKDLELGIELKKIKSGLFRNHGYFRYQEDGNTYGYFTSDEGIFRLDPQDNWSFNQIMSKPIGEVAVMDLNNDGKLELITIEPFHGNEIKIYELQNDEYVEVYKIPFKLDFGHALTADYIDAVPTFFGGIRREGCQFFTIQYIDGKYQLNIVDDGGPSNIAIGHEGDRTLAVCSNHTRNEAAVYIFE